MGQTITMPKERYEELIKAEEELKELKEPLIKQKDKKKEIKEK